MFVPSRYTSPLGPRVVYPRPSSAAFISAIAESGFQYIDGKESLGPTASHLVGGGLDPLRSGKRPRTVSVLVQFMP
jgi:hypothetical protein